MNLLSLVYDETSPHFSVNDLTRSGLVIVSVTFGTNFYTT
jgi:hypothetical protein